MIVSTEDHEMIVARDFIAANWAAFIAHVREKGWDDDRAEQEADAIMQAIGGEA
ncbi:hypothetical protein ACFLMW_003760 [Salmonella enterica]